MKGIIMNPTVYEQKRIALAQYLPDKSIALIGSGQEVPQSLDENYPFNVNNNYYYLTGISEPDGILAIIKREGKTSSTLFIRKLDPEREKWFGRRMRRGEAKTISGIDMIYDTDYFLQWFDNQQGLVLYQDDSVPAHQILPVDDDFNSLVPFLSQMRMTKGTDEIHLLEKAIEITDKGIHAILAGIKPDMYEYQSQAIFEYTIADCGAEGPSFPTIAASGSNGPILHYISNAKKMGSGDLVMFDLGARYQGYCADISRTFPVNGQYTQEQRKIYQAVLTAQKKIIDQYQAGRQMQDIQQFSKNALWEEGIKTGLFKNDAVIDDYYYHGIGHSLGLDTHDLNENRNYTLLPGMVITCEPGLYIAERQLGIRIEDDILITGKGPVVLSKAIPKEIDEIERIMNLQN